MLRYLAFYGVAAFGTLYAQYRVEYTVTVPNPERRSIYVQMGLSGFRESKATLKMPAWAPGSYTTLNFGRWIDSVQAFDALNKSLRIIRKDINTWEIDVSPSLARISYIARDIPEEP